MEINNSFNRQCSPNFGMALNISKKAEPFVQSLPQKERKYLDSVGQRIKNSRNDINIGEKGDISLTYQPKASDIRLVSDENRAAIEAADKAKRKKFNQEITTGERVDKFLNDVKTLGNVLKIKLFSRESKFMKRLKVSEEWQKAFDRDDALQAQVEKRIAAKDNIAAKETENLMSKYGEK